MFLGLQKEKMSCKDQCCGYVIISSGSGSLDLLSWILDPGCQLITDPDPDLDTFVVIDKNMLSNCSKSLFIIKCWNFLSNVFKIRIRNILITFPDPRHWQRLILQLYEIEDRRARDAGLSIQGWLVKQGGILQDAV